MKEQVQDKAQFAADKGKDIKDTAYRAMDKARDIKDQASDKA